MELRVGLRAGSVYYFQSRELSSGEPHFFVVVNRDRPRRSFHIVWGFGSKERWSRFPARKREMETR